MISSGLLLVAAAVFGLLSAYWLARKFAAGVLAIYGGLAIREFMAPSDGFSLGITLYPLDALALLLLASAAVRFISRAELSRRLVPWVLFAAVAFGSFGVGLQEFGVSAGVVFRKFFYFISILIYCAVMQPSLANVLSAMRLLLVLALTIAASVWLRWIIDPAHLVSWIRPNSWADLRVSDSDIALLMAQASMITLVLTATGVLQRRWIWALPALLMTVTVLQHRSVWLATVAGLIAVYTASTNRVATARALRYVVIAMAVACALGVAVSLAGVVNIDLVLADLHRSFVLGITLDTTAAERLDSWNVLLGMWYDGGYLSWFVGQPFGTSLLRTVETLGAGARDIDYSPHNAYLEVLLYTGAVGLLAFISGHVVAFRALKRMFATGDAHAAVSSALVVVLLMQLVYYVPYGINAFQALWVGLAIGLYRGWLKRSAERVAPSSSRGAVRWVPSNHRREHV